MNYARIVVKSNYEKRGDLVLRSYIRALKKIKAQLLLCNDLMSSEEKAYIYGEIKEDNNFYELFTGKLIDCDNYELVSDDEIDVLRCLPITKLYQIRKLIDHVLFNKKLDLDIEVSNIEDLAKDRAVEFEAYNNRLSGINPYRRLGEVNNQELFNAYNNFHYKLKVAKKIREIDNMPIEEDQYEAKEYYQRPDIDNGFSYVKRK